MDPGLYGGRAWLDNNRGYAAFIALEADETLGNALRDETSLACRRTAGRRLR